MIIHTLWHAGEDGDMPWIVDAVDEYTLDANGGEFTPEYLKKRADPSVRELLIDIPEKDVRALFDPPVVKATIVRNES
jgi:hypothetical protein